MPGDSPEWICDSLENNKSNKKPMFSSRGSATSFISRWVSSGTTNTGIKVEMLLPNFNASEFKFCGRAETVSKQPGLIK